MQLRRVLRQAFDELKREMISVDHSIQPIPVPGGIEKCGFYREGTPRAVAWLLDGTIQGLVCRSMARGEYETLQK